MIVDTRIYSKPQAILKRLLNNRNNLTQKQRIIKSVNNLNYNPFNVA